MGCRKRHLRKTLTKAEWNQQAEAGHWGDNAKGDLIEFLLAWPCVGPYFPAAMPQVRMTDAFRVQRQVSRAAMDLVVQAGDWPPGPTLALMMEEQEALVMRELGIVHALPQELVSADTTMRVIRDAPQEPTTAPERVADGASQSIAGRTTDHQRGQRPEFLRRKSMGAEHAHRHHARCGRTGEFKCRKPNRKATNPVVKTDGAGQVAQSPRATEETPVVNNNEERTTTKAEPGTLEEAPDGRRRRQDEPREEPAGIAITGARRTERDRPSRSGEVSGPRGPGSDAEDDGRTGSETGCDNDRGAEPGAPLESPPQRATQVPPEQLCHSMRARPRHGAVRTK